MSHLISCPECKKQLQVPDDLIGKSVQCPECQHSFTAEPPDLEVITAAPGKAGSVPVPTKKSSASDKNDNDKDRAKRRRSEEDDDDDYDERPSRRRKASRRSYGTPHRGGMILAFGIIGLVSGLGIIFGPIAWLMGNTDLREMQAGNMDPEGESMTQTGRILGMIATILSIVGIVIACGIFIFYVFIIALFVGVAANQNKNFPQQRR
jgi:predicted Zn finger-like uncharacterized protein